MARLFTGLVLHTENARDYGEPKNFPYIIMNLTESTLNLMFDKF